MKKLKDKAFFENINEFLCNYLPRIRAKSSLTIMSYKTTLNLLLTFLCSTYTIDIFTVETTMLTSGKNQAMTINELAEKYVCTPIELINKI